VVAAYKRRRRVPFWAMAALSFLPIWGFMYARAVTAQPVEAAGPMAVGEVAYAKCASCHGGSGDGLGSAPGFTNGAIEATFPHIEDMLRWVYFGTGAYNAAGIEIYGNPERDGGPHITGSGGIMPGWGSAVNGELTDAEILGVVCHERYGLGDVDPNSEEYADEFERWCSEDSEIFAELDHGGTLAELHETAAGEGIMPIGDTPVAGSAP